MPSEAFGVEDMLKDAVEATGVIQAVTHTMLAAVSLKTPPVNNVAAEVTASLHELLFTLGPSHTALRNQIAKLCQS